jgi:CheY-like chemotaxis protein
VLVVEDDADLRTLLWRVLTDARHEVAIAADAGDAVEKLHAHRPDLVLLDLVLPGPDGWSVLRTIRRLPLPPAVVMASVLSGPETAARADDEGVAALVPKPFAIPDLLGACERAVREHASRLREPRERRLARRRPVQFPVQVLTREQGWWTDGELVDLASAGARLAMPAPLPSVRTVRVAFALPGDGRRVSVEGSLQWHAPAGTAFAYGLSFVDVLPEAQQRIDALVHSRR